MSVRFFKIIFGLTNWFILQQLDRELAFVVYERESTFLLVVEYHGQLGLVNCLILKYIKEGETLLCEQLNISSLVTVA